MIDRVIEQVEIVRDGLGAMKNRETQSAPQCCIQLLKRVSDERVSKFRHAINRDSKIETLEFNNRRTKKAFRSCDRI